MHDASDEEIKQELKDLQDSDS
jgi:cell division control protein 45